MRKEIGIMQRISYDSHIVQFFGACTTTEPAMLVMEYMRVRAAANRSSLSQDRLPAVASPSS